MTKQRFRDLVKRLHPDTGGHPCWAQALRNVLQTRKANQNRFSNCRTCGAPVHKRSEYCNMHWRAAKKRAVIALSACMALMTSCSTPKVIVPQRNVQVQISDHGKMFIVRVPAMAVAAAPTPPKQTVTATWTPRPKHWATYWYSTTNLNNPKWVFEGWNKTNRTVFAISGPQKFWYFGCISNTLTYHYGSGYISPEMIP